MDKTIIYLSFDLKISQIQQKNQEETKA